MMKKIELLTKDHMQSCSSFAGCLVAKQITNYPCFYSIICYTHKSSHAYPCAFIYEHIVFFLLDCVFIDQHHQHRV